MSLRFPADYLTPPLLGRFLGGWRDPPSAYKYFRYYRVAREAVLNKVIFKKIKKIILFLILS
jgi:hypothetical protein